MMQHLQRCVSGGAERKWLGACGIHAYIVCMNANPRIAARTGRVAFGQCGCAALVAAALWPVANLSAEPKMQMTAPMAEPARGETARVSQSMQSGTETAVSGGAVTVTEVTLAGPKLSDRVGRTIVKRDAKGNFQRIGGRPEIAALAAMSLDEVTRARVKHVVAERNVAVGVLLVKRIEQTQAIADAIDRKDKERSDALMNELFTEFDPLKMRGPMLGELVQVLSFDEVAELARIDNEYWEAWTQWELRGKKEKDRTPEACEKLEDRLAFQLFQEDVRRAYDTILKPYREKIDKLCEEINPTPEQREAVIKLVIQYLQSSRLEATEEQRREFLQGLYGVLDEPRRARLFAVVAREVAAGTW